MESLAHDDLTFEVRDEGPSDGTPVVLLHGFPGDIRSFERVAPLLHEAGLRTLTLHQRGYSPDARPDGVRAYGTDLLVGDVLALLDAADLPAAHVVGHDWGAGVSWQLAAMHPDRVLSHVALSTPHPLAFRRSLLRSTQALRSWYAVSWQIPVVPERAMMARGGVAFRKGLERSGLDAETAQRYTDNMREPGRLTAALNWYRAVLRAPTAAAAVGHVAVPTTYVWSSGDVALGRRAAEDTAMYVDGPYRFVVLEEQPHWLPEVCPDRVAQLIIEQVTFTW